MEQALNHHLQKTERFITVESQGGQDCALSNGTSLIDREINLLHRITDSSDAKARRAAALLAQPTEAQPTEAQPPGQPVRPPRRHARRARRLPAPYEVAPIVDDQHIGENGDDNAEDNHIPFPFVDGQYGHQTAVPAMVDAAMVDADTKRMLEDMTFDEMHWSVVADVLDEAYELRLALNDTPEATFVALFPEWRIRVGVVQCQFYEDKMCHAATWARYYEHGMATMMSAMKLLEVGWKNLLNVLRVASVRTTATEEHYHLSILIGVAAELRKAVNTITKAHGWTLKGTGRMFGYSPSLRPALAYSKKIDEDVRRVEQQLGSPPQLIVSLHQCANEKTVVTITYFEPCEYRERRVSRLTARLGPIAAPPVEPQRVAVDQQAAGTSSDTTTGPVQTGERPTEMGARPTTMGARPAAMGARPTAMGARPTAMGARPTAMGARPTAMGVGVPAMGIQNDARFCSEFSEVSVKLRCPPCVKSSGHTATTTRTATAPQVQFPTCTPRFVNGVSFNVPFHPADLILNVWWLATNAVPSTPQITSRTLFLRLLYHGDDGFALLARLLRTALLTLTSPKTQVSPSPEERLRSSRIPVQFLFNKERPSDDVPTVVLPFDTSSLLTISCLESGIRIAHWTYEKPTST